jgi:hypothetical protein
MVISYALMGLFVVIADFYAATSDVRVICLNIGRSFQGLGVIVFIFYIERYKIFFKRYMLTILCLIIFFIFIIVAIIAPELTSWAGFGYWPFFFIFFLFYLKKFKAFFNTKTFSRIAKFEFYFFLIGILLLSMGYGLSTDIMRAVLGLEFRLIGAVLQLISLVFLYVFIISLPSFSEYDWKEKINEVLIMHKSGLLIYRKVFHSEAELSRGPIVSGSLTTLKLLIEEVTKEKGTSIIEKEGKTVIIQPREFITGVLITDEKLISLKFLLNKLIERIETIYSKVLPTWNGDLKIFIPVESMVKDIFY